LWEICDFSQEKVREISNLVRTLDFVNLSVFVSGQHEFIGGEEGAPKVTASDEQEKNADNAQQRRLPCKDKNHGGSKLRTFNSKSILFLSTGKSQQIGQACRLHPVPKHP